MESKDKWILEHKAFKPMCMMDLHKVLGKCCAWIPKIFASKWAYLWNLFSPKCLKHCSFLGAAGSKLSHTEWFINSRHFFFPGSAGGRKFDRGLPGLKSGWWPRCVLSRNTKGGLFQLLALWPTAPSPTSTSSFNHISFSGLCFPLLKSLVKT